METLSNSPETVREPLTVDRIVAVFAHLPTSTVRYQKNSNLHSAFRQLAEEYPEQFRNAQFSDVGSFVYSESLDNAIDILQLSGFATEYMYGREGEIELFKQEKLKELVLSRFKGMDVYEPIADRYKELVENS